MKTAIKISILRDTSGNRYRLAIDGKLLDQTPDAGTSDILLHIHRLADLIDYDTLVDMLNYKKKCEELRRLYFVSNRELSDWLDAKKGRRVYVVQSEQMMNRGINYETWHYTEETADLDARNAGHIFVGEAGTAEIRVLTRKEIGLEI